MLLQLFDSAVRREFAAEVDGAAPLPQRVVGVVRAFAARQAALTAGWLRVGYVQGSTQQRRRTRHLGRTSAAPRLPLGR